MTVHTITNHAEKDRLTSPRERLFSTYVVDFAGRRTQAINLIGVTDTAGAPRRDVLLESWPQPLLQPVHTTGTWSLTGLGHGCSEQRLVSRARATRFAHLASFIPAAYGRAGGSTLIFVTKPASKIAHFQGMLIATRC